MSDLNRQISNVIAELTVSHMVVALLDASSYPALPLGDVDGRRLLETHMLSTETTLAPTQSSRSNYGLNHSSRAIVYCIERIPQLRSRQNSSCYGLPTPKIFSSGHRCGNPPLRRVQVLSLLYLRVATLSIRPQTAPRAAINNTVPRSNPRCRSNASLGRNEEVQ